MAAPLAVDVAEKVPQAPGLPQLTVQFTPPFPGSLVTVATKGALEPSWIEPVGTFLVIVTVKGATMVTLAVALTRGPTEVELAVITTTRLGGDTVDGAVNVAVPPLVVEVGEMEPQGDESQLTDQVTPEFVVSLLTTAETVAVAFVNIEPGGN